MSYVIPSKIFEKVANAFATIKCNVRYAQGGTSIIVYPVSNKDIKRGTIQYNLYLDMNGFYWRRTISTMYGGNAPYQLFRHAKGMKTSPEGWRYIGADGYYVWEHFATVEDALNRFAKYIDRMNLV